MKEHMQNKPAAHQPATNPAKGKGNHPATLGQQPERAAEEPVSDAAPGKPSRALLLARLAVEAGLIGAGAVIHHVEENRIRIGSNRPQAVITIKPVDDGRHVADLQVKLGHVLFIAEAQQWLAGFDDRDSADCGTLAIDDDGTVTITRGDIPVTDRIEARAVAGHLNQMCGLAARVHPMLEEEFYLQTQKPATP